MSENCHQKVENMVSQRSQESAKTNLKIMKKCQSEVPSKERTRDRSWERSEQNRDENAKRTVSNKYLKCNKKNSTKTTPAITEGSPTRVVSFGGGQAAGSRGRQPAVFFLYIRNLPRYPRLIRVVRVRDPDGLYKVLGAMIFQDWVMTKTLFPLS